jgi:trehalose 6-phosphate synthase
VSEGRLVVVSNRLPPAPQPERPAPAGGLASALDQALAEAGGLWFGWSGEAGDPQAPTSHRRAGDVEYVTVDLSAEEVAEHYEGYCNRALWPLLHGFAERAHLDEGQYALYRRVNAHFAQRLAPLLRAGDRVWVHDYHLLLLGEELRRRGWRGRIGFFLHIPLPPAAEWARLPGAVELARSLAAYDLVGVQTERDVRAARAILEASGAAEVSKRVAAFPIGIDPEHWRALAAAEPASPFEPVARGRRVLFGADRLDYSKGIPLRFEAFERLLEREPLWRSEALLVQWSAPSRGAIPEYRAEQERVEQLARGLDARFAPGAAAREGEGGGAAPASPVWHEVVTHEASTIAAGYREAAVSIVTSLADGMNLVAKEFVAVQRAEDPGVLLLSRGCGAAEELVDALLVDAGDVEGLAQAMAQALTMPLAERRERHRALLARVEGDTVHDWRRSFLAALAAAPPAGWSAGRPGGAVG